MTPKLSVLMPVYNGERFVAAAMESILSQTFQDFEFVVVDDASKDGTPDILHAFAAQDSRLRLHRMSSNSGAIGARNEGIRLATADVLAAMDADDISLPNRLETQSRFLRSHPDIGVVGSFVQFIDQTGNKGTVRSYPTAPGMTAWSLLFFNSICHPTVMFRRQVMEKLGGYKPECAGGWAEDFDLFTRASRVAKLANVPEVLLHYRRWAGNTTATQWETQEASASETIRASIVELTGSDCGADAVRGLRGLATDNYPSEVAAIAKVAHLIGGLVPAFFQKVPLEPADRQAVRSDAGIKLWLLAALASRKSPSLAASIAKAAFSMSPAALPRFAAKVARRMTSPR